MKQILPILLIALFSTALHSQYFQLLKGNIITEACPYDASVTRHRFEYYDIYQTEDNTISGSRIESCITLNTLNGRIDLTSVDQNRTLFISYLFPEEITCNQDSRYDLYGIVVSGDNLIPQFGNDCEEGMCSGLSMSFLHSDESLNEDYVTSIDFPFTEANQCSIDTECGVTEKTEINRLVEFVYRINFDAASAATELRFVETSLNSYDVDIEIIPQSVTVSESYWNGDNYQMRTDQLFGFSVDHIIKHYEPGVPSSENISYTNLNPEVNSATPKPIQLSIEEYASLRYQMHTQLRGGLLDGSSDDRHPLTIEDSSSELCLFSVELIIEDEVEYRLGNGVNFDNSTACIQLRDGGVLTFTANAVHHYGNSGVGNLNLRTGANLILEKGAHFYFDGHLILSEYPDYEGDEDRIIIDLIPGTALTMTKDVTVNSKDGSKLYINMLGGQIDISRVQPQYRKQIELVYPNVDISQSANNITIFPNPANDYLYIKSTKGLMVNSISLLAADGTIILDIDESKQTNIDISELASGIYYLRLQIGNQNEFHKVVVNH